MEDNVCNKMVAETGKTFNTLTMAAGASKATYYDQACATATLTATNTELTSTIKKLKDKIAMLSENLAAPAKKPGGQGGSALPGFNDDAYQTGSAANSDEVFMSTRKKRQNGKMY